jgi:hypothetical protein
MSNLHYLKQRAATYIVAAGLAASVLTGCTGTETRKELSDIIHENAKVVRMEHHSSWIQLIPIRVGKTLTFLYVPYPEKNIIEFDGKVDFEMDREDIFDRFKEGDNADITYRICYQLTFEDRDGDGNKEQTGIQLTGYDFVDAQPKE